jgi:hypothetical protein
MAVLAGNLAGQWWLLLEVAVVLCVGYLLGQWVAIAFCGQALVSIILLEYVNYIRHYGLRRGPDERQTVMHAWQSERRWSRWMADRIPPLGGDKKDESAADADRSASAEDAVPLNEQ